MNKTIQLKAIEIKVRKAAKSINRHCDNGDFTPNSDKVLLIDKTMKNELKGLINRFEADGENEKADYARHLLTIARAIRNARLNNAYTERIGWVASFPFSI